MQYIDSHCHLHDSRIISDITGILERAGENGITHMVTCATMEENFELTADLSKRFKSIIPCFGIHPWFLKSMSDNWKNNLAVCLEGMPSGVGETGLDFTDKTWDRDRQKEVFLYHLEIARDLKRPVNIHIRKAWEALVKILKRFGKLDPPCLIHSYSGSAEMIPILEKFGLFISFSGSVTNPNSKKVVKSLEKVSKNRFVLETDSPDIYPYIASPDPSGLNEPKHLPEIADIASSRIDEEVTVFTDFAYHNSMKLFGPLIKHN